MRDSVGALCHIERREYAAQICTPSACIYVPACLPAWKQLGCLIQVFVGPAAIAAAPVQGRCCCRPRVKTRACACPGTTSHVQVHRHTTPPHPPHPTTTTTPHTAVPPSNDDALFSSASMTMAGNSGHQLAPRPSGPSRSRMLDVFRPGAGASPPCLFVGLRVRMGVATGVVEGQPDAAAGSATTNIMNSPLYKLALGAQHLGFRVSTARRSKSVVASWCFHRLGEAPPTNTPSCTAPHTLPLLSCTAASAEPLMALCHIIG